MGDAIWNKVSAGIKNKSDSKLVYNKKILKIKMNFYGDEATDFYDKKIPSVDSNHTCLPVISLHFALKKDGHYCPQVFLKECKYIKKNIYIFHRV